MRVRAATPRAFSSSFKADEIGFIALYMGQPFPIDAPPVDPHKLLAAMTPFIMASWNGPCMASRTAAALITLAGFFPGLTYAASA